jgi:hypothetical protein
VALIDSDRGGHFYFVYGLSSPYAHESIRYIGKTKNIDQRMYGHRHSARFKRGTRCVNWLSSLPDCVPVWSILEVEESDADAKLAERIYILVYRMLGVPLVNETAGGDGISNPSRDLVLRRNASIRHGITKWHAERRDAGLSAGSKHPNSRANLALGQQKGVPKSPKHRAAMIGCQLGKTKIKWTDARRAAVSAQKKAYYAKKREEKDVLNGLV